MFDDNVNVTPYDGYYKNKIYKIKGTPRFVK